MPSERELQISPIVQESLVHNTRVSLSIFHLLGPHPPGLSAPRRNKPATPDHLSRPGPDPRPLENHHAHTNNSSQSLSPDPLQPPIPHRLPLRRIGRHPRPRVVRRLPFLPRLLPARGHARVRATRSAYLFGCGETTAGHEPLLPRCI